MWLVESDSTILLHRWTHDLAWPEHPIQVTCSLFDSSLSLFFFFNRQKNRTHLPAGISSCKDDISLALEVLFDTHRERLSENKDSTEGSLGKKFDDIMELSGKHLPCGVR